MNCADRSGNGRVPVCLRRWERVGDRLTCSDFDECQNSKKAAAAIMRSCADAETPGDR